MFARSPALHTQGPIYGAIAPRTVMSPYAGGPVYQFLRNKYLEATRLGRHILRMPRFNWSIEQQLYYAQPELQLDNHKNCWRSFVDTSYYAGPISKLHEDMLVRVMPYVFSGLFLSWFINRCNANDKFNVFAKWRTNAN